MLGPCPTSGGGRRVPTPSRRAIVEVFPSLSDPTPTVFADLRVATYDEWDRGLVGIEVDPDLLNGRPSVYVSHSSSDPSNNSVGMAKGDGGENALTRRDLTVA